VLVVGCKLDLRDESRQVSLESLTTDIMNQFKEVVTCIECSAATLYQVCFLVSFCSLVMLIYHLTFKFKFLLLV
jgi:Ras family protein T1